MMKSICPRFQRFLAPILFLLVLGLAPLPALADLNYLTPGWPDAATLLAPPPLPGSAEQAADMDEVKAVYHTASDADKNAAYAEKNFTVFNFAAAIGPFFVATNLPKTTTFFEKVQQDAATVTDHGKDYFHRLRPYLVDPGLASGKLEKSFSYPSGHSTQTMVLALVLTEAVPDQHDAIIAHARLMGWHRVQIARHYPTDIYAGRVLAQAIVRELKKNNLFEYDLADVKTEIDAARAAAKN